MTWRAGAQQASTAVDEPIPLWPLAAPAPPHMPRLPDNTRDVLDAVQAGVMTRDEARRYLGLSAGPHPQMPPRMVAQAFPHLAQPSRALPDFLPPWFWYAGRVALGICWRVCMVGAAILVAQSHYAPPLLLVAVALMLGTVAGLWRLQGRLGQAWRWAALSAGVGWIGPLWADQYAHLVGAVLLIAVAASLLSTHRPR